MIRDIFKAVFILGVLLLFTPACTKDKRPAVMSDCDDTMVPTWDGEVEPIIQLTCAYVGCHVGGTSAPGNYTTYGGISTALTTGTFENSVFVLKDNPVLGMPPANSSGPTELTEEQLNILACWMEGGFPEN